MSDLGAVAMLVVPAIGAFGRLMWWMSRIETRLNAIEQSLKPSQEGG